MNELQLNNITFTPGEVKVSDELANQIIANAESVAEQIDSVEVDETNIKQTKKMLAEAKKVIKALNDKKLEIKKGYMQPYTSFEDLIKEAKDIIDTSEKVLREKTKDIENKEKEEKYEEINEIFENEVDTYGLAKIINFNDWFRTEMLNKTFTLSKVREDLCLFLSKCWNDFQLAKNFEYADEIIDEYLGGSKFDLNTAKQVVDSRKKRLVNIGEWLNEN